MLPRHHDPIVAVATGSGRGAVGIVRVSGGDLSALIDAVVGRQLPPRQASLVPMVDAAGNPIDTGIAIHFPAPRSYTGEDVLELQGHGGPVVLQLLLARCLEAAKSWLPGGAERLPGLRLAQPGEFTERAYLNGKLDLAQAEAVSDVIEASTEAAARSATRSLSGAFSAQINDLRDRLIGLRMRVEASLDFPEEETGSFEESIAREELRAFTKMLDAVLVRTRQGALLREGITVVLAGLPNVGKSSLLNALAGAELAIVTPVAGTTRDKISNSIQIEGVPVHVIDTAGLRESEDEVERIGIARSWLEIERADVVVHLHDLTRIGQPAYDLARASLVNRVEGSVVNSGGVVHVFNKADAAPSAPAALDGLVLSARTGEGLEALRTKLLEMAGWHAHSEGLFIARARHVQALQRTREHLGLASEFASIPPAPVDLIAEELRLANDALGEITGEFTSDDLLGEIFSRFCIGK